MRLSIPSSNLTPHLDVENRMSQEEHQIISFRSATIYVWLTLHSPPTDVNSYERCKIQLKYPFALTFALSAKLKYFFLADKKYIMNNLEQDSSVINLVTIDQ